MSDQQLYLTTGLPCLLVLVGILVNVGYFVGINGRLGSLESRLEVRINSLENRLDDRINSLEGKFDLLTGKVIDLDNRLTRIEEQLKHLR